MEKWILREAIKPFITKELYERENTHTQRQYCIPRIGRCNKAVQELLTRDAIDGLGFPDWEEVKGLLERASVKKELSATRSLNLCCLWII